MRIAVFTRQQDPFSLRLYRENVTQELSALGVEVVAFTDFGRVPKGCHLIWEPSLAGSRTPHKALREVQEPVVATVHGAAPFTMRRHEYFSGPLRAAKGKLHNLRTLVAWRWFRKKVSAVISVSGFAVEEVSRIFGLPEHIVYTIYHGVDHETFQSDGEQTSFNRPYVLQVAQYQPKKNVDRVLAAYKQLGKQNRPNFIAILPGYPGKVPAAGIEVIRESCEPAELAALYRGAICFVFPSLHETFGMPILEAMACGCPVVTSKTTACAEVAGEAAILVNPRSVEDILSALRRVTENEELRQTLRWRGLERAREFTWRKSAEQHLEVFEQIFGGKL